MKNSDAPFNAETQHGAQVITAKTEVLKSLLHEIARDHQPVVFASSLGAEDQVLMDVIYRESLPIDIFTIDTGRLPQETHDLLLAVEQHYGQKPNVFFPKQESIESYVREHGLDGFYDSIEARKACCTVRKVEPLQRALAGKRAWITGLRAQQSVTRKALQALEYDAANDRLKFNPLTRWSEQEVWAYIRQHHVPYNVLHDRGYRSLGCAPCTRAVTAGEDVRAGRWWWESAEHKECGLHPVRMGMSR